MAKLAKKDTERGCLNFYAGQMQSTLPYLNPILKVLIFYRFKGFIEAILALSILMARRLKRINTDRHLHFAFAMTMTQHQDGDDASTGVFKDIAYGRSSFAI
ncbi:hypothetical protein JEM67_00885 [Serratia sp. PAMC26656]|uniref:hypothetical protein n=1 Tax=Serratia sp. PAMC26656 TaxID=2775909 RepID=UPI0018F2E77A|nr:hypothetical protein [Serratia sp. PAMC26656]MBJ7891627.1 hypothetical protein [Serratia sp. PAMC26656]